MAYSRSSRWRTHASVQRSSRGSHTLTGCTLGYVGGTPRKCVRACDAVHLLGLCGTYHRRCTTLHGSALLEGYSTSTHVGFKSSGPWLRVRLRRDADAYADTSTDDTLANALANTSTDDTPADALANTAGDTPAESLASTADDTLADARADHRRAGRCAVGCVSFLECPRVPSSTALRTMECPLYDLEYRVAYHGVPFYYLEYRIAYHGVPLLRPRVPHCVPLLSSPLSTLVYAWVRNPLLRLARMCLVHTHTNAHKTHTIAHTPSHLQRTRLGACACTPGRVCMYACVCAWVSLLL
jgi:hypothetical protein